MSSVRCANCGRPTGLHAEKILENIREIQNKYLDKNMNIQLRLMYSADSDIAKKMGAEIDEMFLSFGIGKDRFCCRANLQTPIYPDMIAKQYSLDPSRYISSQNINIV